MAIGSLLSYYSDPKLGEGPGFHTPSHNFVLVLLVSASGFRDPEVI